MRIALTADSTCDLAPELIERYHIRLVPYTIVLRDRTYRDNVDIHPTDLFTAFYEDGTLPKTSAVNTLEYRDFFDAVLQDADQVIHITLGGALTSSAANCAIVAAADDRIFAVDSRNLSTGMGLLVLAAGKMIERGMDAPSIVAELERLRGCVHSSFVLDTLRFMAAGGRCSGVAALLAGIINMKPCIEVDNTSGSMAVARKYRGSLKKVIYRYVCDQLARYKDIDSDTVFITYTSIDPECVAAARNAIMDVHPFVDIYETTANCTISCHCGPGTLGVLFLTKSPCR